NRQQGLDASEAAHELLVGRPQCCFGVDPQVAGDVGGDKQQVAELLFDLAWVRQLPVAGLASAGGHRLLELADLLPELVEHGCQRRPVEADASGFVLQLEGACERRQRDWNIVQDALWRPAFLGWGGGRILRALLGLDPLPEAGPRASRALDLAAEYMGV